MRRAARQGCAVLGSAAAESAPNLSDETGCVRPARRRRPFISITTLVAARARPERERGPTHVSWRRQPVWPPRILRRGALDRRYGHCVELTCQVAFFLAVSLACRRPRDVCERSGARDGLSGGWDSGRWWAFVEAALRDPLLEPDTEGPTCESTFGLLRKKCRKLVGTTFSWVDLSPCSFCGDS